MRRPDSASTTARSWSPAARGQGDPGTARRPGDTGRGPSRRRRPARVARASPTIASPVYGPAIAAASLYLAAASAHCCFASSAVPQASRICCWRYGGSEALAACDGAERGEGLVRVPCPQRRVGGHEGRDRRHLGARPALGDGGQVGRGAGEVAAPTSWPARAPGRRWRRGAGRAIGGGDAERGHQDGAADAAPDDGLLVRPPPGERLAC